MHLRDLTERYCKVCLLVVVSNSSKSRYLPRFQLQVRNQAYEVGYPKLARERAASRVEWGTGVLPTYLIEGTALSGTGVVSEWWVPANGPFQSTKPPDSTQPPMSRVSYLYTFPSTVPIFDVNCLRYPALDVEK